MTTLSSTYTAKTALSSAFEQSSFDRSAKNHSPYAQSAPDSVSGSSDRSGFRVKEPGSALTHFIGFVEALTAAPFLIAKAIRSGLGFPAIFSCIVFALSMLLLYGASTTYHTFDLKGEHKLLLKKFDHMMIFILIAGSYTPVCLLPLWSGCGKVLLAAVWGTALAGMLFKFFWVTCPKWVSSVMYIGLGWACIFAIPQIYHLLPFAGFMWLLVGGLIYTVGGVIYAMKFKAFNSLHKNFGSHEIFHLFVMAGNFCHFIFVYYYLI